MVLEAEAQLLGILLQNNEVLADVGGTVRPDDFLDHRHRTIYEALLAVIRQSGSGDFIVVADRLRDDGLLDDVGGLAYVGGLAADAYRSSAALDHARLIREHADRRRVMAAAEDVLRNARNEDSHQLRRRLQEALIGMDTGCKAVVSMGEAMNLADAAMDRAEARWRAGGTLGVPIGLPCLDRVIGGMDEAQTWVFAGRPGAGKSAFLNHVACNAAARDNPGLIITLEMSAPQLFIRALANASGQNAGLLFRGFRKARAESADSAARLGSLPLWIDTRTRTLDGILSRISAMKARNGIKWAAVDHIGLVDAGNQRASRNDQLGRITGALKGAAMNLEMPIIELSQMSRDAEKNDRLPKLSDLRDSGNIEQDADGVVFIHSEGDGDVKKIKFGILKNRNGPAGFWLNEKVEFHGDTQRFCEAA